MPEGSATPMRHLGLPRNRALRVPEPRWTGRWKGVVGGVVRRLEGCRDGHEAIQSPSVSSMGVHAAGPVGPVLFIANAQEEPTMETTLLKVPEVALRLSISRAKVYELFADGELRSVRLAGLRRVRSVDLDDSSPDWTSPGPKGRVGVSRSARFRAAVRKRPPPVHLLRRSVEVVVDQAGALHCHDTVFLSRRIDQPMATKSRGLVC
jgi:excisionase family DNA binding protein